MPTRIPTSLAVPAAHKVLPGRRSLRSSLAQQFAVAIMSGELPEGHAFPSEIDYADEIGISRSALREAFRVLAAKGLVDSRPKAGTRVSPRHKWSLLDPEILAWQFESEPSHKFLTDLFELRMMVEPEAAAMAAQRRSKAEVVAMKRALDEMTTYGLATDQGRIADQHFHLVMLEATQNDMVIALSSSIMAAIAWTTIYKQRRRALPRDPIPDHRALYDSFAAGDPDAARRAMAELIRLAQADTEISMRED